MTDGSPFERWDEVEDLFTRASDLPEEERDAFLAAECAGDEALLEQVRKLLRSEPPDDFMEPVPGLSPEQQFATGMAGAKLANYTLEREIGRGGMGVIYLATRDSDGRPVALKLLPPAHSTGEARARFEREIGAASSLDHPAIVPIHEFGESDGLAWYAMDHVAGHDLSTEIERQRGQHEGMAQGEALLPPFASAMYLPTIADRIASLADGLHAAHEAGVVHRDVKPQNVLLDGRGQAYLTDFGLAKDERFGTITATSAIQGTPYYMSPEQARALKLKIDHRTDVYSLAVVLYEALTLRRPFDGETPQEVVAKIGRGTSLGVRARNPRVPRDLALICRKGMEREPGDRYAKASDMAEDLRRFLRHEAVSAKPLPLRARARRWVRAHRGAIGAVLAVIAVVLTSLVVSERWRRSARATDLSQRINAVLELEDLTTDVTRVSALRRELSRWSDGERAPHWELLRSAAELEERLRSTRLDGAGELRRELAIGLGLEPGTSELVIVEPYLNPPRPREYRRAIELAQRLAVLFPNDEEFTRLIAGPSVALDLSAVLVQDDGRVVDASEGEVTVRLATLHPIRDLPENEVVLGTLPLDSSSIAPGRYRIRFEMPGFGHADLVRIVRLHAATRAGRARIHREASLTRDMVRIAGATWERTTTLHDDCLLPLGTLEVPEFHLEPSELSNARFERYLQESGAEPPVAWKVAGYEQDWRSLDIEGLESIWADRPVTALTVDDARACAEWYGKRLPRHIELEFALQSVEPDLTPVTDGASPPFANIGGPRSGEGVSFHVPDVYRQYLTSTRPVADPAFLQRGGTLFHGQGNLHTMTDSPFVWMRDGRAEVPLDRFVALGQSWESASLDHGPHVHTSSSSVGKALSVVDGVRLAF